MWLTQGPPTVPFNGGDTLTLSKRVSGSLVLRTYVHTRPDRGDTDSPSEVRRGSKLTTL